MSMSFAPGPWSVVDRDGRRFIADYRGTLIAEVLVDPSADHCEGTCALLADAYKLAWAVENLVEYCGVAARDLPEAGVHFHPENSPAVLAGQRALEDVEGGPTI